MKIDTHQHYWHYNAPAFPWISEAMPALRRDCLPEDRALAMRTAGIDVALAVQARTDTAETDFLLQVATQHSEVVGVVGWADLRADDLEPRLDAWSAHSAFKGLRHILQDEPDVRAWVDEPLNRRGLRTLQNRQLVYEVLVFEHQLPSVILFCARHDRHWLVLDHVGKPALRNWATGDRELRQHWRQHIRQLAALSHVMCKLSGVVTETAWQHQPALTPQDIENTLWCFDEALEAFGPRRLMFGSDWPVCQLAASYEAVQGLAQRWAQSRLSAWEQDAFWRGNAMRCYGLTVPVCTT
ncbi:L-fuconolactonase [Hydrogenophaga palleronii]|uniref:L-fuconolactonase n=1 Tax=Hydrogenophaga palleronii TaxID=65655 RepID=A0ABU1WQ02_9BURK|nr:amidohydrolase family protein [Hydrogenophaga palleronii]MDR7151371.1 L-fuconolactonase [Hydrogenophaga palleronii]